MMGSTLTHKTNAFVTFVTFCVFLVFTNTAKTNEILTFRGVRYVTGTTFTHKINAFVTFVTFCVFWCSQTLLKPMKY